MKIVKCNITKITPQRTAAENWSPWAVVYDSPGTLVLCC